MKFIKEDVLLENVGLSYTIEGEFVYYIQSNSLFRLDLHSLLSVFLYQSLSNNPTCIKVIDDFLIIVGGTVVERYSLSTGEVFLIDVPFGIGIPYLTLDGKFIGASKYSTSTFVQSVFGVYNGQVLCEGNSNEMLSMFNGNLYACSKEYISRVNINTGDVLWRFSFDSIKNYYPKIYFANKNIVIYGKSMKSGLHMVDGLKSEINWSKDYSGNGMVVDGNNDIIHQLLPVYSQKRLYTGEVIKSRIEVDYYDQVGINSRRSNFILDGKYIITTDNNSNGGVAVFDTETMEYVWTYFVDGVTFPPSKPIVYKYPYLLISDNKNQLHIFKRVDDEV